MILCIHLVLRLLLDSLFYYYLSPAKDVDGWGEATVGGGAWLYIQYSVELTAQGIDLELGGVGTLDAYSALTEWTNGEVIARLVLIALYLWIDLLDAATLRDVNDGWGGGGARL